MRYVGRYRQLAIGLRLGFATLCCVSLTWSCGKAIPLYSTQSLGTNVSSGGGVRTGGGQLWAVTTVVPATQGNYWSTSTASDQPFTGMPYLNFGQNITDRQTPFYFTYSYPSNNYRLGEAHLVF